MEASAGDREQQAKEYLEKHRIMELLHYVTSILLFIRPSKGFASGSLDIPGVVGACGAAFLSPTSALLGSYCCH
jgi:hypothetical protein